MKKNEILSFIEFYDGKDFKHYFLPLKITRDEAELLEVEMKEYMRWRDLLAKGTVTDASYESPKLTESLYLSARKELYSKFIDTPSKGLAINILPVSFRVINPNIVNPEFYEDILKEYRNKELLLISKSEFLDILVRPLSKDQIGLGYKVLPLTKELLM